MNPKIVSIVLAAGASTRMGRPKALLPVGDGTFLTRVVTVLAGVGAQPIIVVSGSAHEAIRAALDTAGLAAAVVRNPAPERGQLSSLLTGLEALSGPDATGALVWPVDVPLVSAGTVARLVAAFAGSGAPIVRPGRGAEHGHPVIFARETFDHLRRADPATGARSVVRAFGNRVLDVEIDDPGAFIDIDTPDDYERHVTSGPLSPRPNP